MKAYFLISIQILFWQWIWLCKHWSRPTLSKKKKLRRFWQNNSDFDISFFFFFYKVDIFLSIMKCRWMSTACWLYICWIDKHLYILALRFCSFSIFSFYLFPLLFSSTNYLSFLPSLCFGGNVTFHKSLIKKKNKSETMISHYLLVDRNNFFLLLLGPSLRCVW